MGIDVYLNWNDRTEEEAKAQVTGFAIDVGDVGYLREAYFSSGYYATQVLFPEAWELGSLEVGHTWPNGAEFVILNGDGAVDESDVLGEGEWHVSYPAAVLRDRLPRALHANAQRYSDERDIMEMAATSIQQFVEMYEELAAAGRSPAVAVSY
jgi:hypothetical protein